jgi:ubiquinone/menaquinone biosynthesis C-methylase UbiE
MSEEPKDKYSKLDVGCGGFPSGDVNCDLFIRDIGHRTGKTDIMGATLQPKKIKNFLICDVQYLPFKENVFTEVFSSHVIEHVDNPFLLLTELVRVSKCKVIIYCPHKLGERLTVGKNPFHKGFFNKSWFYRAARKLEVNAAKVEYSRLIGIPSEFIGLFQVPYELRVEIRK